MLNVEWVIIMFDDITKVAHKLEDIFYYLRESHPDNVPQLELVNYIFKVADKMSVAKFDQFTVSMWILVY